MPRCKRSPFGPRFLPLLLVAGLAGPAWARSISFGTEGFTYTLSQQQPCFKKEIKTTDFTRADLQTIREQLIAAKKPHGHPYATAAAELAEALENHEYASAEEKQPRAKTTKPLEDSTQSSSSRSTSSTTSRDGQTLKKDLKGLDLPGISKIKLHPFGFVTGRPRQPMFLDDSGPNLKLIGFSLDGSAITAVDVDGNRVHLARSAPIANENGELPAIDDIYKLGRLEAAVKAAVSAGTSNYFVTGLKHTDVLVSMFIDADGTIDFTTSESKLWRIPKKGNLQYLGSWGRGTRTNQFGEWLLERHEPEEILGLAGGRDGVRFIADAMENRIYRMTMTGKGEAKFEVIAGNGARFTGDAEATDASKVGLTPMGITVDKKGIITFVEFADQGVRQLIPNQDGTCALKTLVAGHKDCDSGYHSFLMQRLKAERSRPKPRLDDPSRWMRKIALGPDEELLVVDNFAQTITDTDAKVTRQLADLGSSFKNNKDLRIGHFGRVPGGLLFQVCRKLEDHPEDSEVILASTQIEPSEAELLMKIAIEAMNCKSYDKFIKLKQKLAETDSKKADALQQVIRYLPLDLSELTISYAQDPSLHWRVQTLLRKIRAREKELKKESGH